MFMPDGLQQGESLPIIFILSSPRSGSTLLRVMLAGHSKLFSPPELNLLPFCTMAERDAQLGDMANWVMACDQRVGLNEAVMNVTKMDGNETDVWLRRCVEQDIRIDKMYQILRTWISPRRLIDKSTLNSSSLLFLERSKVISPNAQYLHLVRHPYSVVESLERSYKKLFQQDGAMTEMLWLGPNQNILRFLTGIDPRRYQRIYYEELVNKPEVIMRRVCAFLRIDFESSLLDPYQGDRMTTGSAGRFESLGDPNFHDHDSIDARLGEAWKKEAGKRLSRAAQYLSIEFQYDLP
jgi:hypothetical protein